MGLLAEYRFNTLKALKVFHLLGLPACSIVK